MSASARRSSRSRRSARRIPKWTRTTAWTRSAPRARRARPILRDNLYGSIEEDVWRRDFTANALYYNTATTRSGFRRRRADAAARVLRLIGDPRPLPRGPGADAARRTLRREARLHAARRHGAPLHRLAYLLDGVPPARLFDENMKLLLAGSAGASCNLLARLGLLSHLMPDVVRAVNEARNPPARACAARWRRRTSACATTSR